MAGNVEEWVDDWHQSNYYSVSPGSNPPGPASGTYKVTRGAAYFYPWSNVRAASRDGRAPVDREDYRGVRCVGVAPGQ
jgi:formylglycine-generating enzyme required for sulfatase activity